MTEVMLDEVEMTEVAPQQRVDSDFGGKAIPKDVKIYMMQFMPLDDYARMSQVSKEWRRAGKKSPQAEEAQERAQEWRIEQEAAKNRRRHQRQAARARRRQVACAPCHACASFMSEYGWACLCSLFLVLLYCGFSVMVGMFLWYPFPAAPGTVPASSLVPPSGNFLNTQCRIDGFMINQGLCFGDPDALIPAYRIVYNVTMLPGRTAIAALSNVGEMFYDCEYAPFMRDFDETVNRISLYPIGSVVPCCADPLWALPFTFSAENEPQPSIDFVLLDFSSSIFSKWGQTESFRTSGLVLGYIWICATLFVLYGAVVLCCKVCCR